MSYYLQMDGVDDRLTVLGSSPSNLTAVEMDFVITQYEIFHQFINMNNNSINFTSTGQQVSINANYEAVYVNGVQVFTNTAFIPIGTRIYIRAVLKAGVTSGTSGALFFTNSVSQFVQGRVYSIKTFTGTGGAVPAATYDFTQGSGVDSSGNGYAPITITGGTFVTDGPGSVPVSYSYPMKQIVYADRAVVIPTKQRIYADKAVSIPTVQRVFADRESKESMLQRVYKDTVSVLATKQRIYADRHTDAPTRQRIYADRVYEYDTLQVIRDLNGVEVSYSYSMRQIIYADRASVLPTSQKIYADRSVQLTTKQRVYADRSYLYPMIINMIDPTIPIYEQSIRFRVQIKRRFAVAAQVQRSICASVAIVRVKRFKVKI